MQHFQTDRALVEVMGSNPFEQRPPEVLDLRALQKRALCRPFARATSERHTVPAPCPPHGQTAAQPIR
jgi:hypothetical protein